MNNAAGRGEEKREEREVDRKKRKKAFNCKFWAFSGVSCKAKAEGQAEEGRAPKKQFKKRALFGDLFEKFEEKGHFWWEGEGDKT